MATALLENPAAKAIFDEASKVFGYSMADLCQKGPQDKLDSTLFSQPAIFVCSLAAMEMAKGKDPAMLKKVKTAAGFSLGEYSALVFGGALSLQDGLKVVKTRAEAMDRAAKASKSGMASIGPLDDDKLQKVLDDASASVGTGKGYIANYMFPGGRTCSGDLAVLEKACELAKAAGATNAKMLPVSGAFHTPYMESAQAELSKALDAADIKMPTINVYSNVTGKAYTSVDEIKNLLKRQLLEPVKWEQGTKDLIGLGHKQYVEAGPGKQLKAMMRRIDMDAWKQTATLDA
jgi:[acyl-carrier-protein] S-malonyltransferase